MGHRLRRRYAAYRAEACEAESRWHALGLRIKCCVCAALLAFCTRWDAQASSMHVYGDRRLEATAQLDFKIVIPERLPLPTAQDPDDRDRIARVRTPTSRTIERRGDRVAVTISAP